MSFRSRLLVAILLAVLLPALALALLVRRETTDRLTTQYERRVEMRLAAIEDDLHAHAASVASSLSALKTSLAADNRFRRAALDGARNERRYLIDFATNAMRLGGLSTLQVQDESGRILSSGHFRNEYDRIDKELLEALASVTGAGELTLIEARSPQGTFLSLVRRDSIRMGARLFHLVGGSRVESEFLKRLVRGDEVWLALDYPGGRIAPEQDTVASVDSAKGHASVDAGRISDASSGTAPERAIVRSLEIPFVPSASEKVGTATLHLRYDMSELLELRASLDRWFLVVTILAALSAIILVVWLTGKISRPLEDLADKTSRVNLGRLNVSFKTNRRDEIGRLSRTMDAMIGRLRTSAAAIKDAERRATLGEMARQVNHDIKNGLTPIRNVFTHLSEISERSPKDMTDVFRERKQTLDSGITYLENLAGNYARLTPEREKKPCDVNAMIRQLVDDLHATGYANVRSVLCRRAVVNGDALSIRRILENLVDNAVESLSSPDGKVTITTEQLAGEPHRGRLRIIVEDTGTGMSEVELSRVFDDFYTTKEKGTGLGLSIVRRLVMDLGGSMNVESQPGVGSRFLIDFPEA